MFKNYLKIAFRHIVRDKGYSFINIAGLAIGMASFILISLWVQDELSFDRFHKDHDRIFRVVLDIKGSSYTTRYAVNVRPLAPALKKEIPEVAEAARIAGFYYIQLVKKGEKVFYEDRFVYVDPEIFSILTIPFKEGNPQTALRSPHTVVFPERLAKKYFPNENALGKTIRIGNRDHLITGVVEDAPANTHMPYDIFLPISSIHAWMKDWTQPCVLTYVKLASHADARLVERKIRDFGADHYRSNPNTEGKTFNHFLQPITDIYLHSTDLEGDIGRIGNAAYLYIFSVIGLVILLISCINFTNLTTARSTNRAMEVGIRKVAGAKRNELIGQFLTESGIMALLAMLIALGIVEVCKPRFNSLVGNALRTDWSYGAGTLLGMSALTILVAVLAGGYPAFLLSSFKPASVLKGHLHSGSSGLALRKTLVIVQFVVSVALSIGTIIIYQQLHFMHNKNLGFQKEQKIIINVKGKIAWGLDWENLKSDFLSHHGISGAAGSTNFPGEGVKMMLRDNIRLKGEKDSKNQMMYYYFCDSDFLKIYGMELAAGRGFAKDMASDAASTCLINEAAFGAFGWKTPQEAIGKRVLTGQNKVKEIIGVVKNFHFRGVKYRIEPLILENDPGMFEYLTLNLNTGDIGKTLNFIKNTWQRRFPENPLEYTFMDSVFVKLYRAEEGISRLVTVFTGLGLFIACLGLFGLATCSAERRTKEIGIRKILGASVSKIFLLLSNEFTKWVFLANLIAWPIAYISISIWLQNFAYRTRIGIWTFILSGAAVMIIALLTVSYQSIKASTANPVEALRYE